MLPEKKTKQITQQEPLILSHELKYALDILEHSDKHVFISGRAGTGKSTLLQLFRRTSKKRIAVVAPTELLHLMSKGKRYIPFLDLHLGS